MSETTWAELARRCEEAKDDGEPNFGLDSAIHGMLGNEGMSLVFAVPFYTRLLDAITALIERELPGWAWKVGTCSVSDDAWLVPDFNCPVHGERLKAEFGPVESGSIWDAGIDIDRRPPGNVALALCQAFCRAMAAKETP